MESFDLPTSSPSALTLDRQLGHGPEGECDVWGIHPSLSTAIQKLFTLAHFKFVWMFPDPLHKPLPLPPPHYMVPGPYLSLSTNLDLSLVDYYNTANSVCGIYTTLREEDLSRHYVYWLVLVDNGMDRFQVTCPHERTKPIAIRCKR